MGYGLGTGGLREGRWELSFRCRELEVLGVRSGPVGRTVCRGTRDTGTGRRLEYRGVPVYRGRVETRRFGGARSYRHGVSLVILLRSLVTKEIKHTHVCTRTCTNPSTRTHVHVHTHIYTHGHTYVHTTSTHVHTYTHVHTHTSMRPHTSTHVHTRTRTHMSPHKHVRIHVHMCPYVHTRVHVYLHTHPHVHTRTRSRTIHPTCRRDGGEGTLKPDDTLRGPKDRDILPTGPNSGLAPWKGFGKEGTCRRRPPVAETGSPPLSGRVGVSTIPDGSHVNFHVRDLGGTSSRTFVVVSERHLPPLTSPGPGVYDRVS